MKAKKLRDEGKKIYYLDPFVDSDVGWSRFLPLEEEIGGDTHTHNEDNPSCDTHSNTDLGSCAQAATTVVVSWVVGIVGRIAETVRPGRVKLFSVPLYQIRSKKRLK